MGNIHQVLRNFWLLDVLFIPDPPHHVVRNSGDIGARMAHVMAKASHKESFILLLQLLLQHHHLLLVGYLVGLLNGVHHWSHVLEQQLHTQTASLLVTSYHILSSDLVVLGYGFCGDYESKVFDSVELLGLQELVDMRNQVVIIWAARLVEAEGWRWLVQSLCLNWISGPAFGWCKICCGCPELQSRRWSACYVAVAAARRWCWLACFFFGSCGWSIPNIWNTLKRCTGPRWAAEGASRDQLRSHWGCWSAVKTGSGKRGGNNRPWCTLCWSTVINRRRWAKWCLGSISSGSHTLQGHMGFGRFRSTSQAKWASCWTGPRCILAYSGRSVKCLLILKVIMLGFFRVLCRHRWLWFAVR